MYPSHIKRVLAIAALALAPLAAQAQEYPSRAITFVVPFGPGSATDQLARAIGQGVTIALENRPGQTCSGRIEHISERHVETAPAALTRASKGSAGRPKWKLTTSGRVSSGDREIGLETQVTSNYDDAGQVAWARGAGIEV